MILAIQEYLKNFPELNIKIDSFKSLERESLKSDERYHIKGSGDPWEVIFDCNGTFFKCIFFEKLSIKDQMDKCLNDKTN